MGFFSNDGCISKANGVETAFLILYFSILAALSVHGLHILWLVFHRLRHSRIPDPPPALRNDANLPAVTVQLPLYNEKAVVARLLGAVTSMEYPRDRLHIQVLDDSTDETAEMAKTEVERYRTEGFSVDWIHRENRTGFKAGALQNGMERDRHGELVAIFDADFVPNPDFLLRVVPCFKDPKVGMTQVRWGHLNEEKSLLTRLQSLFLDGHFVMESETRDRAGLFLTFNGTAGVWRRTCIEDAGGWQSDTLTEDLDLSYRAQLAGWKFRFLNECVTPAELPASVEAFKSQQSRWTRGAAETLLKLGRRVLTADIPWKAKLEVFFHLTSHLVFPALVVLALCAYPALRIRLEGSPWKLVCVDLPLYILGVFSVNWFYVWGQRVLYPDNWRRIFRIPGLLFLGTGLAVSNTLAVVQAYRKTPGRFARTPKAGDHARSPYTSAKSQSTWIEIGLALYLSLCIFHALQIHLWASIPFLLVFAAGFGGIGFLSLWERRFSWRSV